MTRAHRHAREVQPGHQLADGALVQLHAELPVDRVAQVDQTPADDMVLFQRRALADPIGHGCLLLWRQLARWRAGVGQVLQTVQSTVVVAVHPIAQGLPVHARRLRRRSPGGAFKHEGQRQHATRCRRVLASRRRRPQPRRIQIVTRDRNRHLKPPCRSCEGTQCRRAGPNHRRVITIGGWYYSTTI